MKFFIIIASLVLLSAIPSSYACSCIADPDYNEIIKKSDVVFIGKVISKEKVPYGGSASMVDKVKFNVLTDIKNIDTSTFEFVQYNIDDSSCGINYKVDEVYFVSYLETYQTNFCSTRPISEVGDITFARGLEMYESYTDILVDSETNPGSIFTWGLIPLGIIIFALILIWKKSKKT